MRERDRLSLRAHREELEAIERAERERREAPIRAAEERLRQTTSELAKVYRDRLLGKVKDPERVLDPSVASIRMTRKQADEFNRAEFKKYRDAHPDVYLTPELIDQLGEYWHANGLQIISSNMLDSLVARYAEAHLLPSPPAPEPEVVPEPEPAPIETKPEFVDGWDLESGEPRQWTPRELDRLSSTDYRKALRLYKDRLELPTFGPGPRGSR